MPASCWHTRSDPPPPYRCVNPAGWMRRPRVALRRAATSTVTSVMWRQNLRAAFAPLEQPFGCRSWRRARVRQACQPGRGLLTLNPEAPAGRANLGDLLVEHDGRLGRPHACSPFSPSDLQGQTQGLPLEGCPVLTLDLNVSEEGCIFSTKARPLHGLLPQEAI